MSDRSDQLLAALSRQPSTDAELMKEALRALPFSPPDDYVEFVQRSNGAEGPIGGGYLQLWPVETLAERNEMYAVDEFAPGLVLFGSDGGDVAYAFMQTSDGVVLVEVPFIGMSLDSVTARGKSFQEFIEAIGGVGSS